MQRHPNSYSASFRDQCLEVAKAVQESYGREYTESVLYLETLARNRFYAPRLGKNSLLVS